MFTGKDFIQISEKGIKPDVIEKQVKYFIKGFPYIFLYSPATIENKGIVKLSSSKIKQLNDDFDEVILKRNVIKFVPASGAASRMFKTLFLFRENYDGSEKAYQEFLNDKSFNSAHKFISEIKKFAFYNDLKNIMSSENIDIDKCIDSKEYNTVIDFLLFEKGLNYSSLPKGLLKFHSYGGISRTAFEEHFVEAANYSRDSENHAAIHFTISTEHIEKFDSLLKKVLGEYERSFNIKYYVTYSIQKSSTDTIAVDLNNEPFRETDGSLLFRPGGHGALLENMNDLRGDIIFVKNIDNIVPDRLKHETYLYKKALAVYLSELQEKIHAYLKILNTGNADEDLVSEIITFAGEKLKISENNINEFDKAEKINFLFSKLNRPIRICGMVKNEGEPGGGPFWVKDNKGEISLQIVESSQVNFADTSQKEIFNNSTHFNPVDLVCGVKDFKGNNFDLTKYTDPETGFISIKSKDGKDMKALELPGLWNGAMADWITIFVEVPVITFNPVKIINDLLRKEHQ